MLVVSRLFQEYWLPLHQCDDDIDTVSVASDDLGSSVSDKWCIWGTYCTFRRLTSVLPFLSFSFLSLSPCFQRIIFYLPDPIGFDLVACVMEEVGDYLDDKGGELGRGKCKAPCPLPTQPGLADFPSGGLRL